MDRNGKTLQIGDWAYFPNDTWPAIFKIYKISENYGKRYFVFKRKYINKYMELDEEIEEISEMNEGLVTGPGIIARTDEEKILMELLFL